MKRNFVVPTIMKDEIRAAKRKMKILRQSTGRNSISVELLEALEDSGIDKIATLLNKLYDTGQIPPDMCNTFVELIAVPEVTECELHG